MNVLPISLVEKNAFFLPIRILKLEKISTLNFIIQTPPYRPYFEACVRIIKSDVLILSDYEIRTPAINMFG